MARIGAGLTGKCDAEASWVDEIAMTALAASVNEAGPFEVGHQFAELSRHASIKTILAWAASVESGGVELGEEGGGGGAGGGERGLEGVEHGHEFVHLGDDPVIFGEER